MTGESTPPFAHRLWQMDEKDLIQRYIVGYHAGDTATALAILQAKASVAAEAAAREASRTYAQTRLLAWSTIVLAIATVALVLVTVLKG